MFDTLATSPIMGSLTMTLFHFVWQGALIGLLLKGALVSISVKKSQLRYGVSCLAMFASLIVPIITFTVIYQNGAHTPDISSSLLLTDAASAQLTQSMQATWLENLNHYSAYISLFWLAIVCGLSLRLFLQLLSVNQLPTRRTQAPSEELQARFEQLVARLTLFRKPTLLVSLKVNVPMAIGWLKPVVLLPASMISGLTPAQLDMLLMHELAHIRRHDYLVNFLQTLVEILLFFHPCVHWIGKQMRNEREYCSDDIAVHHCGDPIAYAHTLADTATICKKHRHMPIPSIAMAASGGDLKQRVVRLVDHHCTSSNHSGKWLASVAILIAIMLGSINQLLLVSAIDFNTGKLTFGSNAERGFSNETNSGQQANNLATDLTESSIAKQLLEQGIENVLPVDENWKNDPSTAQTNNSNSIASDDLSAAAIISNQQDTTPANYPADNDTTTLSAQQAVQSIIEQSNNTQLKTNQIANDTTRAEPTRNEESTFRSAVFTASSSTTNEALNNNAPVLSTVAQKLVTKNQTSLEQGLPKANSSQRLANPYAGELAALRAQESANAVQSTAQLVNDADNTNSTAAQKIFDNYPSASKSTISSLNDNLSSTLASEFNRSIPALIEDVSAQLITSVEPKYPPGAKRRGIELDVMVHFTVDKNGKVTDILFERKNKVNYFRSSIRNAVSKWRFQPALEGGKPVESRVSKIFSFNLLQ